MKVRDILTQIAQYNMDDEVGLVDDCLVHAEKHEEKKTIRVEVYPQVMTALSCDHRISFPHLDIEDWTHSVTQMMVMTSKSSNAVKESAINAIHEKLKEHKVEYHGLDVVFITVQGRSK